MGAQGAIAVGFLSFLVVNVIWLTLSVRGGRALCGEFARRFPVEYQELGRPNPGFFLNPRRKAYGRFMMQREFEPFGDPGLVRAFAELRRSEMRQLAFLLAGFGVLGVAALWFEFVHFA
jgi:hypothetical protein